MRIVLNQMRMLNQPGWRAGNHIHSAIFTKGFYVQSLFVTFYILSFQFLVELTNSQVLLKCGETKGAMLITSANTQILKRLHRPVTANNDVASKLNKVTWTGKLSNLQVSVVSLYFLRQGRQSADNCWLGWWPSGYISRALFKGSRVRKHPQTCHKVCEKNLPVLCYTRKNVK